LIKRNIVLTDTLSAFDNHPARFGPHRIKRDGGIVLNWALIFLVVAIVAAVFGFGGIAGTAAWIAKILFLIFIVLFVVGLVMHLVGGGKPPM